ncbi:TIGR01777 family oxidoreductase [Rummeliibacillus pycnus]|uniref:TIGR01777 family oxidoreductase n=1 Tax=Rummeliibacillus pycnus TaxID=101070 RepID=UPI000C9B3227|nr:TIGR01777 family oxidoreductase [Rummeliibacillus pycnus]
MKIAITGGSGFVGQELVKQLQQQGHEIIILTRKKNHFINSIQYIQWLSKDSVPENYLEGIDAVVNLAGTSINNGRWTEKHQKEIYDSRILATNEVIRILKVLKKPPKVLVNASAIGVYPASTTTTYSESSTEIAHDFLAKTVQDWEQSAISAEKLGVRVVLARFGVILGKNSGALPMMVMPYKFYVGGTVGRGSQWVSWVHVTDVVAAIIFAINNEKLNGIMNVTAPNPVCMKNFGETIATVTNRPHWFPVPAFILKIALGKKSQLILEGQRVLPKVLLDAHFQFQYPTLKRALENLL